jgi:hypothetical protein
MDEELKSSLRGRSTWLLVLGSVFLTLLTFFLLQLYGTAHWEILTNVTGLERDLGMLRRASNTVVIYESDGRAIIDAMEIKLAAIRGAGHWYMAIGNSWHVTGFSSFGVGLAAFFRKPRWLAWVGLLSGLVGGVMALGVM